jgi:glycosyltransferase involved in cell wall biosynthesis
LSDDTELLSIIVPVYNEVRTIRAVVERLLAIDLPVAREILVVDDASTDGTRELLERVADRVTVLRLERNAGKGSAVRHGLAHARGSIVAIQDADLELDPAELRELVAPIVRGDTAVVFGSRFLRGRAGAPLKTYVANRVLTGATNLLYRSSLTDMETCHKVMRTGVAQSLGLTARRFELEPEITARLLRHGHGIRELPVRFDARSRAQGKKIGWRDGVNALWVLVRERMK